MEENSLNNNPSKKNDLNCQLEDQAYANENMILIIGEDGIVTSIKHKEDRVVKEL